MESLKLRTVNLFFLIIISIFNLVDCIIKKSNYLDYIIYILPFIIIITLYLFIKSMKMDAYLFLVASIFSIIFGDWGNLTGAIFLCFSIFCFKNNKAIIIILACTIITIVIKFIANNSTLSQSINYILGYTYIILIYYILIHPKKGKESYSISYLDEIDFKIIKLLISGLKTKDIADRVFLTTNAIIKRLEKLRKKIGAYNNEQLVYKLIEKGIFRLN